MTGTASLVFILNLSGGFPRLLVQQTRRVAASRLDVHDSTADNFYSAMRRRARSPRL
jgi:hypothetical protein